MGNLYEADAIAWAEQQVWLLRSGHWSQLDIDNLAEEIEDVGKSEKRELLSRFGVLIAHLLKWTHQPERRGRSWRTTIRDQRAQIERDVEQHPSLKRLLGDRNWLEDAFSHARTATFNETSVPNLPIALPWTIEQLLAQDYLPE